MIQKQKYLLLCLGIIVTLSTAHFTRATDTTTSPLPMTVELSKSNPLEGWVDVNINTSGALTVEILISSSSTVTPTLLGSAIEDTGNLSHWRYPWDTQLTPNGTYVLFARVRNAFGIVNSDLIPITIENHLLTNSGSPPPPPTTTTTPPPPSDPTSTPPPPPTPSAIISFSQSSTFFGSVAIAVDIESASRVELFTQTSLSAPQVKLGDALQTLNSPSQWYYTWDTTKTINGTYLLIVKITNTYGSYTSSPLSIAIYNTVTPATTDNSSSEPTTIGNLEGAENTAVNNMIAPSELPPPTTLVPENDALTKQKLSDQAGEIVKKNITEDIQHTVDALRAIENRSTANIQKDSDEDSISDYDEINIFGTNPYNNDTDHDGKEDASEMLQGLNPKNASPTSIVAYENPREAGTETPELFLVKDVSVTKIETKPDGTKTAKEITLKGRGQPSSFLTLYIFSTPIVVTVKTDINGDWSYVIDKELEDGTHDIFVTLTDGAGRIIAKSTPFPFIKRADAATLDQNAIRQATTAEKPAFFTINQLILIGLLLIGTIGLALLLIGIRRTRTQQ